MSVKSKLTDAQKKNIRAMCDAGIPKTEIAQRYGISRYYVDKLSYGYEGRLDGLYIRRKDRMLKTGITPKMIAEVKRRIHPGMKVICLDKIEESDGRAAGVKRRYCKVIGTYPHIFTVQRPYGIDSYRYTDLIRHNGVKETD